MTVLPLERNETNEINPVCPGIHFMALQEFERAMAQLLSAAPSMVIVVTSQERMSFTSHQITSKSLELQPLAAEDAEEMIRQQVAKQTPKVVVAELAALCCNIPIVLSVVSKSVPETEPSAAQVPPLPIALLHNLLCMAELHRNLGVEKIFSSR